MRWHAINPDQLSPGISKLLDAATARAVIRDPPDGKTFAIPRRSRPRNGFDVMVETIGDGTFQCVIVVPIICNAPLAV